LGAIGYFGASAFFGPRDARQEPLLAVGESLKGEDPRGSAAPSLPVSSASDPQDLSLLSSALEPGFVEFLDSPRIQRELSAKDVDLIELRLLSDLPAMKGSKHQDPRDAELGARVAILRALQRSHLTGGIDGARVPELTALYKKLLQAQQYGLHFKAQALRNLATLGVGAEELAQDGNLDRLDPRIHRLAVMGELDALVSEE
jgi:hypothetical protein